MFRLFGPFEVWQDGVQVDPGDLQQRYVLVILLLNANRAVSREYLQEYVWRGQPSPKSDLITSYIARLRKVFRVAGITDAGIEKTPTGYVLRVNEDEIDTVRFARLCTQARATTSSVKRTQLLTEALDLWRGPFLSDLDLDRVGGSTVAPPEDARIDALVDLAELELAAGHNREIRDRLWPVWEEDRSQQRIAAKLMRALIANGDPVRAVAVFHQTRDALEEFGMETTRELRDMAWMAQYGERVTSPPSRLIQVTTFEAQLAAVHDASRVPLVEPLPATLGDAPDRTWPPRGPLQPPARATGAIGVALIDGTPLMREGLSALVHRTPGLRWVGAAENAGVGARLCQRLRPNVVLIDAALDPFGQLGYVLAAGAGHVRVLLLIDDLRRTNQDIAGALTGGVAGVIRRAAQPAALVRAIQTIHAEGRYLDPALAPALTAPAQRTQQTPHEPLSVREHEVLALIADGLENHAIANVMYVSVETVRTHVKSILRKLSSRDRTHAVAVAFRSGVLAVGEQQTGSRPRS